MCVHYHNTKLLLSIPQHTTIHISISHIPPHKHKPGFVVNRCVVYIYVLSHTLCVHVSSHFVLRVTNFSYLLAVRIVVSNVKVVPPSGHYVAEMSHKCQCTLFINPDDVNGLSDSEWQSRLDRTCLLACFREYLVITWSGTLNILRFLLGYHKPPRQIMPEYKFDVILTVHRR